jgi:transcriptional regulator with XRE-family HTH domain
MASKTSAAGNFPLRLARAREMAGLTVYALAKRANVSRQFVAELEAGNKEPTLSTLRKLAQALGTTVGVLVD